MGTVGAAPSEPSRQVLGARRRERRLARATAVVCAAAIVIGGATVAIRSSGTGTGTGTDVHSEAGPPAEGVEALVAAMSVDELVGQMTWLRVFGTSADDSSQADQNQKLYGVSTPAEVVRKYSLGGVVYFDDNLTDPRGVAELSDGLQAAATGPGGPGIPLATTIDQEGGIVARVGAPATELPGAMPLGATGDQDLAAATGGVMAAELAAMGINVNFAPVLDVNSNPDNPVIGVRSFGGAADLVSGLGAAQLRAMQEGGVSAAAKHFPGHGDTDVDSHTGLPVVDGNAATLSEHLAPFRAAVDAGVDLVMTAHVVVRQVDPDVPATLSPAVLSGLLREDLGFTGLVVTDSLQMQALHQIPGRPLADGEISVLAVQAGADVLLDTSAPEAAAAGVRAAVEAGEISRERLEESVRRIVAWKIDRGIWSDDPGVAPDDVDTVVGTAENRAVAAETADRSVTLIRNDGGVLPLAEGTEVYVTGWGATGVPTLVRELQSRGAKATGRVAAFPDAAEVDALLADIESSGATHVVLATTTPTDGESTSRQRHLLGALLDSGAHVIQTPARTPYEASWDDRTPVVLASYGTVSSSLTAVSRVIMGEVNPTGTLPVDLPGLDGDEVLYPTGHGLRFGVDD